MELRWNYTTNLLKNLSIISALSRGCRFCDFSIAEWALKHNHSPFLLSRAIKHENVFWKLRENILSPEVLAKNSHPNQITQSSLPQKLLRNDGIKAMSRDSAGGNWSDKICQYEYSGSCLFVRRTSTWRKRSFYIPEQWFCQNVQLNRLWVYLSSDHTVALCNNRRTL